MAFDSALVERVRALVEGADGLTELRMFGGWGITLHGHMAVGVLGPDLVVRVGSDDYLSALERPGARPFDFTGRAMTGWVFVDGTALARHRALQDWVERGVRFARSLPPKAPRPRRRVPGSDGRRP